VRIFALKLELFLPGCHSLKEKRRVVRSLIESLRANLNVSIAETDHHDKWQRAQLGVVWISSDGAGAETYHAAIRNAIEQKAGIECLSAERSEY